MEGLAELHTHLGGSVSSDILWTLADMISFWYTLKSPSGNTTMVLNFSRSSFVQSSDREEILVLMFGYSLLMRFLRSVLKGSLLGVGL